MIAVDHVTVILGGRPILQDFSLNVGRGQCVGLLGPSGSGKSTLLRTLVGELMPSKGSVSLASWQPVPTKMRLPPPGLVSMVFQDPIGALDPLWNIGQCVAEPLQSLSLTERNERIKASLGAVKLGHVPLKASVRTLSVGQAQRVCIARAIAPRPKVILADEPTSALDATTSASVVRLLHQASVQGASILVVSHNAALLESFCSTVVSL
jgi:peptide/nickel transport system ATP-binding protein